MSLFVTEASIDNNHYIPTKMRKLSAWETMAKFNQQVHVLPGESVEIVKEDGMIRWEILKQLTKFTYWLETDEEDGMGWSDERP